MFPFKHIHILGAAGAGTTTLGANLAAAIGGAHLDTDDHYWLPTWPPYREKRPPAERLERLRAEFARTERWVLSGSLLYWGVELAAEFNLVVLLFVPPAERQARVLARERQRYGNRIEPGGELYDAHRQFMAWAATYDTATGPGRNLVSHRAWLADLTCPVLEIAGTQGPAETLRHVLAFRGWSTAG
jgi:adenylate kinase family enzyme